MIKKLAKITVFFFIFIIALAFMGELFKEKRVKKNSSQEAVTSWVSGYADLEEDTVDVLFLGSSQNFCTVNPCILWKEEGIASYVLGSSAQDAWATKAYLEYGLKEQSPRAVFVECAGLVLQDKTEEQWNRRAYDNLPFSISKFRNLANSIREEESFLSYVFPVLRFHERWEELGAIDFEWAIYGIEEGDYSYKGYYPRYRVTKADLTQIKDAVPDYELTESTRKAIYGMKEVCDKVGAELVLWKAPAPYWREVYKESLENICKELGIKYVDLNYSTEEIGIDSDKDFYDSYSHLNDSGATKVSSYLAQYLKRELNLPDHRGENKYEDYETNYHHYVSGKLPQINELEQYLSYLVSSDYDVFFCVNDGMSDIKNYKELFGMLPFENLSKAHGTQSYVGVLSNGNRVEADIVALGEEAYYTGTIGENSIEILSQGYHAGDSGSIKINGEEYMVQGQRGLGIVVYDRYLKKVVDSVTFDIKMNAKPYRKK